MKKKTNIKSRYTKKRHVDLYYNIITLCNFTIILAFELIQLGNMDRDVFAIIYLITV